jgi:hypothetical protein
MSNYLNWESLDGAFPGPARLARETGYDLRTIQRLLADLVTDGWLVQTTKGGSPAGGSRHASIYRGTYPRHETVGADDDPRSQIHRPTVSDTATHDIDDARPTASRHPISSVTALKNAVTEQGLAPSRSGAAPDGGAGSTHEPDAGVPALTRDALRRYFAEHRHTSVKLPKEADQLWAAYVEPYERELDDRHSKMEQDELDDLMRAEQALYAAWEDAHREGTKDWQLPSRWREVADRYRFGPPCNGVYDGDPCGSIVVRGNCVTCGAELALISDGEGT